MDPTRKKSWLDKLRDRYEIFQIRRRRHQSIYYIGYVVFLVLSYTLMIGSNLFIGTKTVNTPSEIGKEFSLYKTQYQLISSQVDAKNRQLEFTIAPTTHEGLLLTEPIEVSKKFSGDVQDSSKVSVLKGDRGYYTIALTHLPTDWEAVQLTIAEPGTEDSETNIVLTYDPSKNVTFSVPTEQETMINSLDYFVKLKEEQIQLFEDEIEDHQAKITETETRIKELESEKAFQTEAEISQTDQTIQQNRSSISTENSAIQMNEKQITEIKEQIQKLKEKKESLQ